MNAASPVRGSLSRQDSLQQLKRTNRFDLLVGYLHKIYAPEDYTRDIDNVLASPDFEDVSLIEGSLAATSYGKTQIVERHRHRYEVNNNYRDQLAAAGLRFSGTSPDDLLVEIVELPDHPFFIAVQFHPELKSKPFAPHPLFADFIRAGSIMTLLFLTVMMITMNLMF